jgi:hypothetical protein
LRVAAFQRRLASLGGFGVGIEAVDIVKVKYIEPGRLEGKKEGFEPARTPLWTPATHESMAGMPPGVQELILIAFFVLLVLPWSVWAIRTAIRNRRERRKKAKK